MKPSNDFKKTIEAYIKEQAETDPLFAHCIEKEGKNIDDCCTYIINWVKKSGCSGFSDAEIFGQAMHYYQEDNINVGKPVNCKVVVNHVPQPIILTDEEIQQARQDAIEREIARQRELLHSKKSAVKKEPVATEQASLF